ncbi:hypothetical protein [Acinetobacter sp. P1(2025)]|uniref:hypothetical protein n=1 Tax=Acinetobacter sp. P1(2025) TaxID=3446120 RepID=UPI003F52D0A1
MQELNLNNVVKGKDNTHNSRHRTPRKAIGLSYDVELSDEHALALSYWLDAKLATPLVWLILDELAEKGEDAMQFVQDVDAKTLAQSILDKLKSGK